jgi:hypothetical protein
LTAWGKEVGGLQAGLAYKSGEKRTYRHGETVTLVLRVRNVSKEEVKFSYLQPYCEHALAVTDATGKPVPQPDVLKELGARLPREVALAPGKEFDLHELKRELRPASESGNKWSSALYGEGKVRVQYEQVLGNPTWGAPRWKLDPVLSRLATGKLELDIRPEPPPAGQKSEEESFTAWGKEVSGVRAGLGYLPGRKRTYHHGEKVKLVLRVRNVGKEAVEFHYDKELFREKPPVVADVAGKPVRLGGHDNFGSLARVPKEVRLAPGKEIEIAEWQPVLRPASEKDQKEPLFSTLYGTGKVLIQYKQLGHPDNNPTLSQLATGKLELEIK